jgi:hypothetical protein
MSFRFPGAYAQALDAVCSEIAYSEDDYLTASADPLSLLEYESRVAERKEALIRERSGQPVRCRSAQLLARLPAPFERFPRDGQRRLLVYPSDEIVLLPRESRTA